MATEQEAVPAILDLMTGRWRSQVLHAGVALGIYACSIAQRQTQGCNGFHRQRLLAESRCAVFFVSPVSPARSLIVTPAQRVSRHVEAGGLISYGVDLHACLDRAATYVYKTLNGAAPPISRSRSPRRRSPGFQPNWNSPST